MRLRVLLVWWLDKGVRGWPWWTLMPASTLRMCPSRCGDAKRKVHARWPRLLCLVVQVKDWRVWGASKAKTSIERVKAA
jgi:hypothetical protein